MARIVAVVAMMLAACGGGSGGDGAGGGDEAAGGGAVASGGGAAAAGGGTAATGGGGASCVPACNGRSCGPDGCGGVCGACGATEQCVSGQCECLPESDAEFCANAQRACDSFTGADRCGVTRTVSCGQCAAPRTCGGGGTAGQCGCTPQCNGKVCGADGCGGSCGTCPTNSTCAADQTTCACNEDFWVDPQATMCVALGTQVSPADGYPANGYCVNSQYWLIPDAVHGLTGFDCGPGQCRPDLNGGGSGSCTCGSPGTALPDLSMDGFCLTGAVLPTGFADRESMFTCFAGNTYYDNCKAVTGQAAGVCQTLISSFGSQSNCYCNNCVRFDLSSRQCTPACTGNLPVCSTGGNGMYSCFSQ